ncbi:alkyl hydroperoxide reductase [Desulfocurvibacter africanus]|uniref:alkyl hydroperoxide reductase n=1 Tax=Desulfocurvibacter africanus TaxID=873 RepID=UPI000403507B|nr:alkyl hydroperoxide reductase [Desulfocurvibacter africanus]
MRLGYHDVRRYPAGWQGWLAAHPDALPPEARPRLPGPGDTFPAELPEPFLDIDRRILGPGLEQADFLLLELHSSLCGCCQEELPVYQDLHARISADLELTQWLRMAGIAAYDTRRDLAKARRTGQIGYPLLPDERGEAFAALGRPELPVIMLLRRKEGIGRDYQVLLSHQGRLPKPDVFFEEVRRAVLSR